MVTNGSMDVANLSSKGGSHYQRLKDNNSKTEANARDFNQNGKYKVKMEKYSESRISRGSALNNMVEDNNTGPVTSNTSENEAYNRYKFQPATNGHNTSPKKGVRDFSTGVIRRKGQSSLTNSKDNVNPHHSNF